METIKIGDFNINKNWKYNPGTRTYFNPDDTTQAFNVDANSQENQDLNRFFDEAYGGANQASWQLRTKAAQDQYFPTGFSGVKSLSQLAQQKYEQSLLNDLSTGTKTIDQVNSVANIPQQSTYQTAYPQENKPIPGSVMTAEKYGAPTGMTSYQAQQWLRDNGYSNTKTSTSYNQPSTKTFSDITPISTPNFSLSGTNLNIGSTGSDVSQLQEFINFATGSNLKVDGQYGSQTQNAVKQLQSRLGITADGIVGPQTTKALNEYMAKILKANPSIKAPTSINSGNLQPGSTTNLPSRNSTTSSGADSLIGGITANMSAEEAKVAKQYNELEGEISKLLGNSVGQGQAQINAEKVAGVPGLEKELANLNSQIKVGLAEYQIEKDKYDALSLENRNKPVTMNSIIGSEAAIDFARQQALNRKASDIGLLQAQASGVAGNLELAQNTANKAVELKYADIKTMLDVKMQQLSILGDKLSREEKKTADFLNRQYEMQKAEIDAQEGDEKALNNFTLDAMQDYRSAGIRLGDSYETIQSKILGSSEYRAEQTKGSGSSGASTIEDASNRTMQVLDGFITIDKLTPAEQQKVRDDLYSMGLNSSTPPQWYKEYLEDRNALNLQGSPISPTILKREWDKYRTNLLSEPEEESSGLNFDDL